MLEFDAPVPHEALRSVEIFAEFIKDSNTLSGRIRP